VVLDRALVREAEGLLADMMADPDLPRHLLSGLRAISDLLKSTDASLVDTSGSGGFHRVKSSPVASLSDCSFASEYADLPYAERPIYLPKVCLLSWSAVEQVSDIDAVFRCSSISARNRCLLLVMYSVNNIVVIPVILQLSSTV